jgi:hypothetical protein
MVEKQCQTGLRHYRTASEAQQLIAEYEASGVTCRDFCKRKGVPVSTLTRYLRRYKAPVAAVDGSQQWVTVELAEPRPAASALVVVVRGGRRIEIACGFDPAVLERVVIALERIE